jgi:hypothetical protein
LSKCKLLVYYPPSKGGKAGWLHLLKENSQR